MELLTKQYSYWFDDLSILRKIYNEPLENLARRLHRDLNSDSDSNMWSLLRLLRFRAHSGNSSDQVQSVIEALVERRNALLKRGKLLV